MHISRSHYRSLSPSITMNPPDQPTQPSETHKQLAADVFRMVHNRDLTAAAQLIAASEARAVAQLRSELNYTKASETLYHDEGTSAIAALNAERERVRVLSEHGAEALMVARSWQMVWGDKLSPDSVAIFTKHEQAFLAGDIAEQCAQITERLWKEFITLMEITEESDSGNEFRPNKISSCRAIDGKRLNEILAEARRIVF